MQGSSVTSRAGQIAWLLYDVADTAFGTIIQTFIFAAFFTRVLAPDEASGTLQWGLAIGGAGLIVAVLAPFLGAAADQYGRLKPWLAGFVLLCAAATAGLWWIEPSPDFAIPAMLLVALGTIGSQAAMIFYNAMLPHLVPPNRQGLWSGWGWGAGYIGGLACLLIVWALFLAADPLWPLDREAGLPVRASCIFTAFWLILFSLPLLFFTPERPAEHSMPLKTAIRAGLAQLLDSLRQIRRYRDIVRFLLAHLLYKDALAALFAMGGVFAAGTFGMSPRQLLLFGVSLNISAGLGAIGFAFLDQRLGSRQIILLGLGGLMVMAICMLWIADSMNMFWIYGTCMGLFFGPIQASSRAYLGQVAPEALRGQMFGLFTLSGRATAFVGPVLVGWVTVLADSQRVGMSVLLIMFALGFALLWRVPSVR